MVMGGKPEVYDYSDFQTEEIGDNMMARIEGLAQKQVAAEALVESLEAQLVEAKANFRLISEKDIPNLLDEFDLADSTVNTPAGHEVKMATAIRGSIPKANETAAFQWLEDDGNGNLIKRQVTIEFGKDQEAWAAKFQRDCAKRKKPLNMKIKRAVHAGTLQAFVRRKLDEGVDIPMDTFGVFRQRFAKVTVKTEETK